MVINPVPVSRSVVPASPREAGVAKASPKSQLSKRKHEELPDELVQGMNELRKDMDRRARSGKDKQKKEKKDREKSRK